MIQIGATDELSKATELLARAKTKGHATLNSAQPFTEKVQKGSETLYRARFAGLGAESAAEAACKALKRSGFSCFATKN
jgi:D-alanyl-D-alanine carboxypeptidase